MVGYAFAAQYRSRVTCFVVIDAPLPGVGPWEEIQKNPLLWHFRFGGPAGHGAPGRPSRAHLPRPVPERVLRHPKASIEAGDPSDRVTTAAENTIGSRSAVDAGKNWFDFDRSYSKNSSPRWNR
jgi:hypothetical protein